MLQNKHIYVIVVSHICCSKNPTTCTCFFFFGMLYVWTHVITQTRYPSSQCHNGILQVLRWGIMIMFELCHGWRSSSHTSPPSETGHVSGCSLLKDISYEFMSDITCRFMCFFFLVPCLQQRSETNSELVYSNRTWVQAKMPTAVAGDCQ